MIVLDDDDNDNDAQSTLGTTAEEDNSEEESEEARRARIRKDIDRILYNQIDAVKWVSLLYLYWNSKY